MPKLPSYTTHRTRIYWTSYTLYSALKSMGDNAHQVLLDEMNKLAPEITDWMKAKAPWTDRTGRARAGLNTKAWWEGTYRLIIEMSYGADTFYGTYLENMRGGRYNILKRALTYWGKHVLDGIGDFMDMCSKLGRQKKSVVSHE